MALSPQSRPSKGMNARFVMAVFTAVGLASGVACARRALANEPGRDCRPGGEANRAARETLRKLDAQIGALHNGDDTGAALSAIEAFRAGPCLIWSQEDNRSLKTRSALALRTFWEGGGSAWLWSYLEPVGSWFTDGRPDRAKRADEAEFHSVAVIAPDVLPAPTLEAPLGLPEAILCPAADDGCGGGETRGWRVRAEQALRDWRVPDETAAAVSSGSEPERESCWQQARRRPLGQRYSAWRVCIEVNGRRSVALPLGEFRSPHSGWWVLRMHRQREARDEMWAYDVATGAAYVAQRADQNGARAAARAGRVPTAALREALWMAALSAAAVHAHTAVAHHPLPAGLVPRLIVRPPPTPFRTLGVAWSSEQEPLAWRWVDGARVARGELTWPWSSHPARDCAVRLLAALEAAFVEGCAPAPLPLAVLERDEPPTGDEGALPPDRELVRALSEVASSRACP